MSVTKPGMSSNMPAMRIMTPLATSLLGSRPAASSDWIRVIAPKPRMRMSVAPRMAAANTGSSRSCPRLMCAPVDSALIAEWFADLVWGPDKVAREDERIRTTRNVNRTTEISSDWSTINDIYEAVIPRIRAEIKGITLLGGHSSHSYINGTNMYFNYFYDLIDCEPEEENDKYYFPIIQIICEETLRLGGSIVHHHGIGKARARWVKDEYGSSYPMLEALKRAYDPQGVMNMGTIIPR